MRKIKITESQYNNLQEYLFETTDINHTLDFVKNGDTLIFKNPYIIKIKVIDVNQAYGEIHGITQKGENVKLSFNSFDEITKKLTLVTIDKVTNKSKITNIDGVQSLDIERDGNILSIKGDSNTYGFKPEIPILSGDSNTKNIENPEINNKIKQEKLYGKKALKIITSDPILQAAFYKQPTFWKLFIADLNGQTAPGKGIQPTLDLVNRYLNKKNIDKNQDLIPFKMGRKADFELLDEVLFNDGEKELNIPKNQIGNPYVATNVQSNFMDKTIGNYQNAHMLQSSEKENHLGFTFKIMVKGSPIKEDIYECDIVYKSNIVARDVKIKFLNSSGYNYTKTKK